MTSRNSPPDSPSHSLLATHPEIHGTFLTAEACRSILRDGVRVVWDSNKNAEAVAMWWHRLNYASVEALRPVKRLLDEAATALNDHAQSSLHETPLPEILGSAVGVGAGAATVTFLPKIGPGKVRES